MRNMQSVILTLALTLALTLPTVASAEGGIAVARPVSGTVTAVNPASDLLYVGPMRFYVPEHVHSLTGIPEGVRAVVHYEKSGGQNVARSVEIDAEPQ